jgi:hypothetical protein
MWLRCTGRYDGIADGSVIAWDLYRVTDGRIVEHSDGRQMEVTVTASGHSMLDGPTEITQPAATEANQRIVESAIQAPFLEGDFSALDRYSSPTRRMFNTTQASPTR